MSFSKEEMAPSKHAWEGVLELEKDQSLAMQTFLKQPFQVMWGHLFWRPNCKDMTAQRAD